MEVGLECLRKSIEIRIIKILEVSWKVIRDEVREVEWERECRYVVNWEVIGG